jgi:hypothetical protein
MELAPRIELGTPSLPRKYSTAEPCELIAMVVIGNQGPILKWSGRRDSNSRHPPWKGGALPTELRPQKSLNGGAGWIRTTESLRWQIYSLLPLATREPRLTMELLTGIEPATYGLQNRCSTN